MEKLRIRNILVPIDFSKMSVQAIETAQRLARRSGGSVHLVHVHQLYYPAGFMAPGIWSTQQSITFEQQRAQVTKNLTGLARKHSLSPADCHVLTGAPAFDDALAEEVDGALDHLADGHADHPALGPPRQRPGTAAEDGDDSLDRQVQEHPTTLGNG